MTFVRLGLVLVGVSLAVVGAGVIAAVTFPVTSPPINLSRSAALQNFTSPNWQTDLFHVAASSSAGLSFAWNGSGRMSVSLANATSCTSSPKGWCEVGKPFVNWTSQYNGTWSGAGPASSLYVLAFLSDSPSGTVNFSADLVETYHTLGPALPTAPYALAVGGGGVLLGIGGLASYLGLFLPPNPFAPGSPGDPPLDPALGGPEADPAAIEEELRFRA